MRVDGSNVRRRRHFGIWSVSSATFVPVNRPAIASVISVDARGGCAAAVVARTARVSTT
jgi:hypothetical protein